MSEKISQLPSAASVPDEALVPVVVGGISQKATALQLRGSGGSSTPSMLFRTPLGELLAVSGDVAIKENVSLGASPSSGVRLLVQDSILVASTITLSGSYATLDNVSFDLAPTDVITIAFTSGGALYVDPGTFGRIGNLSPGQLVVTSGTIVPVADSPISVVNPTELAQVPAATLRDGALVHVQCFEDYFGLVKDPPGGLTADGLRFVATVDGGAALWVRKGIPSWKNASQPDWFVDAATGSDVNDGNAAGAGHALATIEELNRRLCPNGAKLLLRQSVTVHVAAGSYGVPKLNIDPNDSGWTFLADCAYTSSANITVSATNFANTNSAGPTRGRIQASSGTPFAGQDKKRVRVVSGSHVGAIAYICGVNNSGADVFVSHWTDATFTTVNIAAGDVVAIDTPTATLASLDIQVDSFDDGGGFELHHAIIAGGGNFRGSSLRDGIWIQGCELQCVGSEDGYEGSASYSQCRATGSLVSFQNGNPRFAGVVFQATLVQLRRRCWAEIEGGNLSDGSRFQITRSSKASLYKSVSADDWEFARGAGIAAGIECLPGGSITMELGSYPLWGVTGSNYTVGIALHGGAHAQVSVASDIAIPSVQLVTLAGQAFTQGQLPAFIPRDDCGIAIDSDSGAPYVDSTVPSRAPFTGTGDTSVNTPVTIASLDFASFRGLNILNTTAEVEIVVTGFSTVGSNYSATYRNRCSVRRLAGNITIVAQTGDVADPLGNSMGTVAFTASGTVLSIVATPALTDLTKWFVVGEMICNRVP